MNENKNNQKQFETVGKHRIVIDGIPFSVILFFRTDTKETGMDMIMRLAKQEIAANSLPEEKRVYGSK